MQRLNFPRDYDFDIKENEDFSYIFDTLRRKYLELTPEEWVRQNLLRHLIEDLGYPAGRTAVESGFSHKGNQHRADIIVHDRSGSPILVAECKAPDLKIDQAVFDQVSKYNSSLDAPYLLVTNGLTHFCYRINREDRNYQFLDSLPRYGDLEPIRD